MSYLKPPFKWKGGKQRLLPQLIPFFPANVQYYVEPFLGGGAIRGYFENVPARLSDTNPEVMNTWRMIRDKPVELHQVLEKYTQQHSEQFYAQIRAKKYSPFETLNRAARFLYLNKTCFNGIYRENSKGEFNVPKGDNDHPTWDLQHINTWSGVLQRDTLWCQDFERIDLEGILPGAFFYFDPPYYGTSGYEKSFTWKDHIRLGKLFRRLTDLGIPAMLSNSDTEHTRTLFRKFNVHSVYRNGTIGVGERTDVKEILVINYE